MYMSSSNSLAAARRRRAQSNQSIPNPGQQQHLIQQPMQSMPPPAHQDQLTGASHYQGQMQSTTKASTPMQLLTQHDMRIFSMEQNMQNILIQLEDKQQDSGTDLKLQESVLFGAVYFILFYTSQKLLKENKNDNNN